VAPSPNGKEWVKSYWTVYVSIVVVVIIMLTTVGLISTQPWSRIKIVMHNEERALTAHVQVWLDDQLVVSGYVPPGENQTMGIFDVEAGSHFLAVELCWSGDYPGGGTWGEGFNNIPDWTRTVEVGPLLTKNVRLDLASY